MKRVLTILGYTILNIRYASLILPCGIVAYLLQIYPLAVMAGILLVAAFAAEVALSIANGFEASHAIQAMKQAEAEDEALLASFMTEVEDWSKKHGSEAEAGEAGSEAGRGEDDPGEGQAGVRG